MNWKLIMTIVCCFLLSGTAFGQVSKTLHQTFTLDGAEKVNVNVVGKNVELKETKGSRILVETKVTISLPNPRLLDFVANSGRYDLLKTVDAGTRELTIASKKSNDVIVVKGQECSEVLEYVIYLPESVKFANNSTIVNGSE
jgi:hypothetical protein